jgi:hypothetical protein
MRCFCHRFGLLLLLTCILLSLTLPAHADGPATAPAPGNLHDQLIAQYMEGKWEDVEKELIVSLKEISAMPPAPRTDVEYIRHAIAEGKPPWWKLCKAGKRVQFKPLVWRAILAATYDPTGADSQQLNYVNGAMSVVLGWKAAEMDNPAMGELEFTRGENNEIAVWNVLGNSLAWSAMSPHFLVKLSAEDQLQFKRFVQFRGNVTAAYYCSPRARRLAVWSGFFGFSGEYAKSPDVMTKKAVGIFYISEVLGHPETYPSVKRPEDPPADGAEAKIVTELQDWIRRNNLTFAEDKALREAIKAFASANASEAKFRQAGKIVLPNGLTMALDPAVDKPLAAQRDAWIKARFAKPQ